ncbi:MAG: hypothetical protein RLZ44_1611 [Pseudomonadota bacterium]
MKTIAILLAALAFGTQVAAAAGNVYGSADAPLAGQVLDTDVHTADAEELRYVVLRELTDRYAAERGIEVQQGEIEAYVAAVARSMAEDRKQRAAERERLAQQLQSGTLSPAEREALSSQLRVLDELLAPEGAGTPGSDGKGESPEDRAAREQIAAAFILQWKINRALYQQYGGRIIFQQGGPEPLDAYRLFLEEQQKQGAFKILDPALEAGFWRYYRTDAIHSFYPAGSAEEARAFAQPWWLSDNPEQAQ